MFFLYHMLVYTWARCLGCMYACTSVMSMKANSKSGLNMLSLDTQFGKPLPITAEGCSHVTAFTVKGWRRVIVEGDLSHFQGR